VNVTKINAASNSDHIYMCFGNPSAPDAQSAANVWDDDFRAVWHLNQSSLNLEDSTSYNNHITAAAGTPDYASSAKIGDGLHLDSSSSEYVTSNVNVLPAGKNFTFEGWMNPDTIQKQTFVAKNRDSATATQENELVIYWDGGAGSNWCDYVEYTITSHDAGAGEPSAGNWDHYVFTIDTYNDVHKVYCNGELVSTKTTAVNDFSPDTSNFPWCLGMERDSGSPTTTGDFFDGYMDEVRFSNRVRSADWIAAQYRSQSNTFIRELGEKEDSLGAAYVFLGGPDPDPFLEASEANITLYGSGTASGFGHSVSTARDLNQDGFDDVIVGAPFSGTWWNGSWDCRMCLTFDNRLSSETLVNFPVLVNLSSQNFDYSRARPDGMDLRFVDGDDKTVLTHHIERFDPDGYSLIWVNVTGIDANSDTDHIWMYYNNSAAKNVQDPAGTYDHNFRAVWHLNESPATVPPMRSRIPPDMGSTGPVAEVPAIRYPIGSRPRWQRARTSTAATTT
jgi:hypothetical protein